MANLFQPLRRYADFSGRATRSEFWLWQLVLFLLFGALQFWIVASLMTTTMVDVPGWFFEARRGTAATAIPLVIAGISALLLLLPSLAVAVRRLHDGDMRGWWLLIAVTGIGNFVLLLLFLADGTKGPNRFGADPRGRSLAPL